MNSTKFPPMAAAIYYASALYFGIVCITAITINISIIIIYFKNKMLRSPFNNLLMNIVFMEMFSTIWGLPLNFVSSLTFGELMKNDVLCLTTGMGLAMSGMCSVYTVTILAIHRFFVITFPHLSKGVNSALASKLALVVSWIFTIFTACPPVVGYGSYERDLPLGVSCGPDWTKPSNHSYSIYLVVIGFILPVFILIVSSAVLLTNLYKRSRQIARLTSPLTTMSPQSNNRERREKRVTKMVLAMTAAFICIWSPYVIAVLVTIIKAYQSDNLVEETYDVYSTESIISTLPIYIVKLSTFVNPIIYIFCNSQFRSSLEDLWRPLNCFRCNRSTGNEGVVLNQVSQVILTTDHNKSENV